MPRIPDKAYMDFSGGIRRDKSPFILKDNELQIGRNFDIDEQGRIVKRRGMQAFGNLASSFFNSATFYNPSVASATRVGHYIVDNSSNVYLLSTTNLTSAITASSTTVTIDGAGDFASSGTIEIEGDIITYTGKTGDNLTGATGITSSHAAGVPVHQWVAGSGVTSGTQGSYFAILNENLLLNTSTDVYNEDDHTDAAFANAATQPQVLFLTTFKTRVYGAGNGLVSVASSPTTRIFYSAINDGTTWTPASDYFDVEDARNESVSGLKEYNNNLMIFKWNSIHRYNLASLTQINSQVGAWNHFCPQEINGILYTFCPGGIFATNGESAQDVGEPVKEYWKNFQPIFESSGNARIVTNCSAGKYKHFYLLYVGDVTLDDASTLSDVVLVYNTITKSWTVYDGFTDLINFIPFNYREDNEDQVQIRPSLFFTSTSLGFYIAFDNRTLDGTTVLGGDLTSNMFRDTGTPITMNVKTKPYDLGYPNFKKQFGYLKVFSERPGMFLSYQIDDRDPKPLGLVDKKIKRFPFPLEAKGHRCAILIDESSTSPGVIYNGHIFEDCATINKDA